MFALLEVDVTYIRQRLRSQRKEGHKTSFFGFLLSTIANAIEDNKELNHIRCAKKLYNFEDVDIDTAIELKHNGTSIPRKYVVRDAARKGKDGGNVPGAADNLSACAISVAMCRFLVKTPLSFPKIQKSDLFPLEAKNQGTEDQDFM